jgi:NAD(P)-dependent dehydrogenase (short-subunit alcohol dehydrogenase family)
MVQDFIGRTALVTGGASGIGRATALLLAARGARVAVLDLDPSGAPEPLLRVRADVADDASAANAVADALARLGRLDVRSTTPGSEPMDEWRRVLDVNLLGLVRVTRAALPALRRSDAAAIVNVGSIVATAGLPERALYSASKGAVAALTRAMAVDHVHEGIRVNCVHPGTVDTPWIRRLLSAADDPDAELAALKARQPNGRLVDMDEVAHAITYLANPHAASVTGTELAVDGGMSGLRPRRRQ